MENGAVQKSKKTERLLQGLLRGGIAWSLAVGLLMTTSEFFGIFYSSYVLFLAAAAGILLHAAIQNGKKSAASAVILVLAGAILLAAAGGEVVLNGILAIYNQAAETLGRSGYLLLQKYTLLSEQGAQQDMLLVFALLGALAGWICHQAVCGRKKSTAAVCVFLAAAFLCINAEMRLGWQFLAGGAAAMSIYVSYYDRKQKMDGGGSAVILYACVTAALCCGLVVWLSRIWLPQENYEEPELVKTVRSEIFRQIDQFRYQKEAVNTLPKGDLQAAETWETTENTALRITMSEPDSLYLRGYVGSVYDGSCWQELAPEVYYENQALFYWLNEWGVSGNTQLSALRENLQDRRLASDETSITIENVNADSEYLYIPYELKSYDAAEAEHTSSALWKNGYGENAVHSGGLFGKRNYSYTSVQNLVKDFPQAAAQSYLYRRKNPQAQYTEAESYYNVFVYENYTKLPLAVQTLLEQELGYAGELEDGHADYRSVIRKIRSYLESKIVYGNYAEALPEGEDFLSFFLTESQIGSAVHYASAAVLMFRYYGIPARYAEGYLITPEDAQQAVPGEPFELPGSRGHAWTEIYVDGLGWVPIEMTPEYYDVMEQPDLTRGLQTDSSVLIQPPKEQELEQEQNTAENLKEHLSQIFLNLGKLILWMLIGFDLFCVLVFLYLLLRRFIANRKRHKAFHDRDVRTAVCSMTGYMERLMQELGAGLSDEATGIYRMAHQIGQKAAFSPHRISEEERRTVEAGRKKLLKLLKKKRGWYEKWILKYIERLY